jgi:hypothetical protein
MASKPSSNEPKEENPSSAAKIKESIKPELKDGKHEIKDGKPEIKDGKFEVKEHKDFKDQKDHKEQKEHKDQKEHKEQKDHKEEKDHKEHKEHKDTKDHKEQKEHKDQKDHHKEFKIEKIEVKEHGKELENKLVPENRKDLVENGPNPVIPNQPDPAAGALAQRVAEVEAAVAELSTFISADLRPDLTTTPLYKEPDQSGAGKNPEVRPGALH